MRKAYSAESLIEAQLVVDLLQQQGITTQLFNQNSQGALGELPMVYPEVWLHRDSDHAKAARIIRQFEQQAVEQTWLHCPRCGEDNPPTFEICWQCTNELAAPQ